MRQLFKMLKITMAVYATVYLLVSFILWDFINPFTWLVNIPIYNAPTRFAYLFIVTIWFGIMYAITHKDYKFMKNDLDDKQYHSSKVTWS